MMVTAGQRSQRCDATPVVNALNFLEDDRGMDRATAYAYLSAAANFTISQVVDKTVGVHAQIAKSHFA
jgi:acetamidase/formamidase